MADDASREQSPADAGWKPSTGREHTAAEQTKHHRGDRLRRAVRKGGAVAGLGLAVTGIGLNLPDGSSTPQRPDTSITQTDSTTTRTDAPTTVSTKDLQLTAATVDAAPVAQAPQAPALTEKVKVDHKGESIYGIGQQLLEKAHIKPTEPNATREMHRIIGLNSRLKNPDVIHKGDTLVVPTTEATQTMTALDTIDLTKVPPATVKAIPDALKPVFKDAQTVQEDHERATHYPEGTRVGSQKVRDNDVKLATDEATLATDIATAGDTLPNILKDAGIDISKITTKDVPAHHAGSSNHSHEKIVDPVDETKFSADVQKGLTAGFFTSDTLGTKHTVWDKVATTSTGVLGRPLTDAETSPVTRLIEGLNPENYKFTDMHKDTKFTSMSAENIMLVAALSHITPQELKPLEGKIPIQVYAAVDSISKLNSIPNDTPHNLVWNQSHSVAGEYAAALAKIDPTVMASLKDRVTDILKHPETAKAQISILLLNPDLAAAFALVVPPPALPTIPGTGSPDGGQPGAAGPTTPAPTETKAASPTASSTETPWTTTSLSASATESRTSTSTTTESSSATPADTVSSEPVPTGTPSVTETPPTGTPNAAESSAAAAQSDYEKQQYHKGMPLWKAAGIALSPMAGAAVLLGLVAGAKRFRRRPRLGRAISRNAKKAGKYVWKGIRNVGQKVIESNTVQNLTDSIATATGRGRLRAREQQDAERAYLMERIEAEGRITPLVRPEINRAPLIRALVDKRLKIGSDRGIALRGIATGLIRDTGEPAERITDEQINLFAEVQARLTRLQLSYTPGRTNELIAPSTQTSIALLSLADRVFSRDSSIDSGISAAVNTLAQTPTRGAVAERDRAVDALLAEVGITIEQTAPATRSTTIPGGTPRGAPVAPEAQAVDLDALRRSLIAEGMMAEPATRITEAVRNNLVTVSDDRLNMTTIQDRVQTQFPEETVPPEFMRLIQEIEHRFTHTGLGQGQRLTLTPRADQQLLDLVRGIDRSVPPTGGSVALSLDQIMEGLLNAGSAQGREAIDNILAAIGLQVH